MRFKFLALLSVLLLTPLSSAAAQPLRVVTSLQPLKLITDQIMLGAGQSEVLIPKDSSPHHFQLRPSQIKLATQADLLIWVSDEFETGLNRLQKILPAHTLRLELIPTLSSQPHNDKEHGEAHDEIDGHIWLSPERVMQLSARIAEKLSTIDSKNALLYRQNAQQLNSELQLWKQQSQQRFSQLPSPPRYILDHEFLTHFEQSFEISHLGTLHNKHDHGSRMRSLSTLHQRLQTEPKAKCLLVAQMPVSTQTQQILQQYQLSLKPLYILGEDSPKTIQSLLDQIVSTLTECH